MELYKLKEMCIENKIPIVRDKTIDLIVSLILKNNFKIILEIGTAYGYSANYISNKVENIKIDTIENKNQNYEIATSIKNPNITYIFASAFNWETEKIYDFIFFDGPKNKQEILFEKFEKNLCKNGIIVIDNIFLKDVKPIDKRKRSLIKKVKNFEIYLKNLEKWNVEIIDIDDGIALCSRKKNENNS